MQDIYLNKKLKTKYMLDFNNLLESKREFWSIDDDALKNELIDINKNQNIQTLYSRMGFKNANNDKKSYLMFAFTKESESRIFREVLPRLIFDYNTLEYSACTYEYFNPNKNPNYKEDSLKFELGCTDDNDYFMINRIQINLDSYNFNTHLEFWKDLKKELQNI